MRIAVIPPPRSRQSTTPVYVQERMDAWLKGFDAIKTGADEVARRNLAPVQSRE